MTYSTKAGILAVAFATSLLAGTGAVFAQMGGPMPPVIPPNRLFEQMDTNKDGAVSKQEYLDHYGKNFDSVDKNKDGKITPDEMPTTKSKGATQPKTN